jgi:hypothetical protein
MIEDDPHRPHLFNQYLKNPGVKPDALRKLVSKIPEFIDKYQGLNTTLYSISRNPNATADLLRWAYTNLDRRRHVHYVLEELVEHANTPNDVLESLAAEEYTHMSEPMLKKLQARLAS